MVILVSDRLESRMARVALHVVVFLLSFNVAKASLDGKSEKRDLKDKWPVLSAILESKYRRHAVYKQTIICIITIDNK